MAKIKNIWNVAAIYVGTIIGAGFATGKEIVEFFSQFGFIGFVGLLLAGFLFIYFGKKLMITALKIGAKNYFMFNEWLFGKRIGRIVNIGLFIMLSIVTSVMLAGAAEVIFQIHPINKAIIMVVVVACAIFIVLKGVAGLGAVNALVVPMMIMFNILLFWFVFQNSFSLEMVLFIPEGEIHSKVLLLPFAYVAFNLMLSMSVFVPLAHEVGDFDIIKKGALLGGIIITIILIFSHLSLITFQSAQIENIPTVVIMKIVAPFLYIFYLLIVFGEIFSTIIGNAYGMERQISEWIKIPSLGIYIIFFLGCFMIAQFEYARLLSIFYPMFGYIGIVLLFMLWIRKIKTDDFL